MNDAVLIVGATSAIARGIANALAADGRTLILAARDTDEAERLAADLRIRHNIDAATEKYDALDSDSHSQFFQRCLDLSDGALGGVVMCQGYMAPQAAAQNDPVEARRIIDINYTSAATLLNLAAAHFEPRKRGFICGVSSVAGDRGRQSNYVYGSAKAAFTTFLQGLRNRLTPAGVPVITIKPGFVDTAMTWGLPGMFLVASPHKVGRDVRRAINKKKSTVYTPWFWWGIMTIIKSVPEPIFRRMKM
jgi:short-subunit dehydrogenase